MDNVYITGVAMTRMGRLDGATVKTLTREAVSGALDDAGVSAGAIEAAYFSNATQRHLEGQLMIPGQIALRDMGIESIPVVNVENACASGSTALNLAAQFLKAGEGDVALAVGAEKMWTGDKAKMFSFFDSGWELATAEENEKQLLALGHGIDLPEGSESEKPYSVFMAVYAAFARAHMRLFGTTQAQFAAIAAKNHMHSVENDKAQFRDPYTVGDVLGAPPITYPLTLPMCAPMSDGGAAAVLMTEAGMKRHGISLDRAIELRASVIQTGSDRDGDDFENHLTAKAARRAYEKAGLGPEDVSVAEVHDATAVGELIQIENLGLFPFGEGAAASERGETTIGGRVPVNPSGGLECKGHPIGATGLGQVYELVSQLRGECGTRQVEGAKVAIAENGGGLIGIEEAVASVLILARQESEMFKTEEQTMACDMLRRFLDDQIEPEYLKVKDAPFEKEVIQGFLTQLSEFGLTSAPHPEEAGGMGLDWSTHLMLFEEVGVTAMDIALPILINVVGADLLLRLGTDEQRARYIPQLLAGETSVAIGISEPGVGSDVAAVKTRARKDGGDWVISGEKTWISNGRFADFLICTCNTGEGLTHILVDRKEHGFETRDIPKIGLNAQSTSQVFLDEVRVPVENTIGAEGRGLQQTLVVFERARVHMAMWGIALARRALEESIRYAQERNQHGKQIAGHQMIADKIATMATEIDAARLLTHRAAGMIDRDERCDTECAMAKWYGTEIAVNATRQAVQIHGGNGVTREFIVERLAREAIIGPIPDGTTEIQKLLIARSLTGVAAFKQGPRS